MSDTSITGHVDGYLADYIAGELSLDAHDQIERHLSACVQCQAALAQSTQIRLLLATLAEEGDEVAPVALRVKSALATERNGQHDIASSDQMNERTLRPALDEDAQALVGPRGSSRRRSRPPLWIGLVAVFLLAVLSSLIFSHIRVQPGAMTSTATQTRSLTPGPHDTPPPLPTAVLPPGWQTIAPGKRFTAQGGPSQGLVASLAKPDRIAGCALPVGVLQASIPVFMLSDTAGQTWQTHAIPGMGEVQECIIAADSQRADTFIVTGGGGVDDSYLEVTEDAGQTWRALPSSPAVGYPSLVGGRLLGLWSSGVGNLTLGEMTLDGVWRPLDTTLPVPTEDYLRGVQRYAVDPHDATHIYAMQHTSLNDGSVALALYMTRNGGASWRLLKLWTDNVERFSFWMSGDGAIYYNKIYPSDQDGNPLYWSVDGGLNWRSVPYTGADFVALSPQGRYFDIDEDIRLFNPKAGTFQSLGIKFPNGTTSAGMFYNFVVLESPTPILIGLSWTGTYAVRLKSLI